MDDTFTFYAEVQQQTTRPTSPPPPPTSPVRTSPPASGLLVQQPESSNQGLTTHTADELDRRLQQCLMLMKEAHPDECDDHIPQAIRHDNDRCTNENWWFQRRTDEEYILRCAGCHMAIKISRLGRLGKWRAALFAEIEAHLDEHGRMAPMEFVAECLISPADTKVPDLLEAWLGGLEE